MDDKTCRICCKAIRKGDFYKRSNKPPRKGVLADNWMHVNCEHPACEPCSKGDRSHTFHGVYRSRFHRNPIR